MEREMQHNAHVYAFWNAPLSQRRMFAEAQLKEIDARLTKGGYEGADEYYSDKRRYWAIIAAMSDKKEYQVNPMGYWFAQSN
jgi:hypothetical protein